MVTAWLLPYLCSKIILPYLIIKSGTKLGSIMVTVIKRQQKDQEAQTKCDKVVLW